MRVYFCKIIIIICILHLLHYFFSTCCSVVLCSMNLALLCSINLVLLSIYLNENVFASNAWITKVINIFFLPFFSWVKDTPNFISSGSKIVKRLRRRQYEPLIIERTIGLVLGPGTALYIPFLKHCTLTNMAIGTIWRALSKPPQRWQGPDLRILWLLVGTPSAIRTELASRRAEHSLPYPDMFYVYQFLWPLRLGWLLVCGLYKEVYLQIFKRVSLWLHGCCEEWEG